MPSFDPSALTLDSRRDSHDSFGFVPFRAHVRFKLWAPTFGLQPLSSKLWPPTFELQALGSDLWAPSFGLQALGSNLWVPSSGLQPLGSKLWPASFGLQALGSALGWAPSSGSNLWGATLRGSSEQTFWLPPTAQPLDLNLSTHAIS